MSFTKFDPAGRFLSREVFSGIMKRAGEYGIQHFNIAGLGEPLYHYGITTFLLELRSNFPKSRIEIFTSAYNLTDSIIDVLSEARVDVLNISFYGWDKESYENSMIGLDFDQTLQMIKKYGQKKSHNSIISLLPRITKKLSYEEANKLGRLVQECEIQDCLVNPRPCHNFGGVFANIDYVDNEFYAKTHDIILTNETRCKVPLRNILVSSLGDIYHCYVHSYREPPIGNVANTTFQDVEKYVNLKFQELMLNKTNWSPTCAACNAFATYGPEYRFLIQSSHTSEKDDKVHQSSPDDDNKKILNQQAIYWKEKLSSLPSVIRNTNFPTDFPRTGAYSPCKETIPFKIEGQLYDKLVGICGHDIFNLYTYLMTALKVCIYKYTKAKIVSVGSPAYGSDANTLVILDMIEPETSFQEFRFGIRETLVNAYTNQKYGYQDMIKDLNLESEITNYPLFNVELIMNNLHIKLTVKDVDITIELSAKGPRFPGMLYSMKTSFIQIRLKDLFLIT